MSKLMYIRLLDSISRQRILMHILYWMTVTGFFFFVFRHPMDSPARTLTVNIGFMPGHILFAYAMMYFVVPRFLLKGRIFLSFVFFLIVLAMALLYMQTADVYLLHYSGQHTMWRPRSFPREIFAVFSIGWIAVSIKLVKYWFLEKEVQQQLEKEKLTVELQLLKSQLHPHFLFNTLNNLYSLTLERSQQAPTAVLQLSALLRYMLYECNEPFAPLIKEIDVLETYIGLEKFRFRERLEVSTSYTGGLADQQIAPLLLLPFLENAVKHGTSEQLDQCWISLHLHVENDIMTFKLINSMGVMPQLQPRSNTSGLGLQNVRRRLSLLYPGHQLKITPAEDTFMVTLTIPLSGSTEKDPLQLLRNYYNEIKMPVGR